MSQLPQTMRAVAIDAYGGIDQLKLRTLPLPEPDAGQVLIRLQYADIAVWDPAEREGAFESMNLRKTPFPLVLGGEGAGEVVSVGEGVTRPRVGDTVYAATFLNPTGGLYAEYAAVPADSTSPIPNGLTLEQAAVFGGDAATALRGLEDVLHLKPGESVMIFGAGGGLGHLAVQLAKRLGARVFAVASRQAGVDLALKLGADAAIDGRTGDVSAAARAFAPVGLDAALMSAGGEAADRALTLLKPNGRCAYPHGVMPEPKAPAGITAQAYNGDVDGELLRRLNALVSRAPFTVHIARSFSLDQVPDAHRFIDEHYHLGKLSLKIG